MEDTNDNEIRTLKDQNATLVLENKSLHNKLSSQTEQSKFISLFSICTTMK